MTIDIRTLFTVDTAERLLSLGLELAAALGLPVTSWRPGDPMRTLLKFLADQLASRDTVAAEVIKAGWLRSASGSWKTLVAQDVFGIERDPATYATPTVTLANSGGAVYNKAAGEVLVKASSTGVVFRSTEALALASGPGTSDTIALVADTEGAVGSVGTNDIDEIVTTMLGVTIASSTAAVAADEQSDASLETECFSSLGSISVNGPPDAYNAVALNEELTGVTEVTRAATSEDADDGTVSVWIAGASGAVAPATVTAVQTAIEAWSTPATITPTVINATVVVQGVVYEVSGEDIPASAEDDIETLVLQYYAALDIGGYVSTSALIALAHDYLVGAGATDVLVELTSPAGGALSEGQVATVSSVTVTEV